MQMAFLNQDNAAVIFVGVLINWGMSLKTQEDLMVMFFANKANDTRLDAYIFIN